MSASDQVTTIDGSATHRLECRAGDMLVWLKPESLVSLSPRVTDYWFLRADDRVTITNRLADLPTWFQLHPTEANDAVVFEMARKLEAGWIPGPITEGSNTFWRVSAGDRLVWLPHRTADSGPREEQAFDFRTDALASGEPHELDLIDHLAFGSVPESADQDFVTGRLREALSISTEIGLSRTFAVEGWGLSHL